MAESTPKTEKSSPPDAYLSNSQRRKELAGESHCSVIAPRAGGVFSIHTSFTDKRLWLLDGDTLLAIAQLGLEKVLDQEAHQLIADVFG